VGHCGQAFARGTRRVLLSYCTCSSFRRRVSMSVKHLPPAVKQLLKLRNPNSRRGPSQPALNSVFTRTFQDAKHRNAETGWLVLSASNIRSCARLCQTLTLPGDCLLTDMHAADGKLPSCRRASVPVRGTSCPRGLGQLAAGFFAGDREGSHHARVRAEEQHLRRSTTGELPTFSISPSYPSDRG
jgi:hypothetical protein